MKSFVIDSRDIFLSLDGSSLNLDRLKFKGKDIWDAGCHASVSIYDYLTRKEYSSGEHKTELLEKKNKKGSLCIKWKFSRAPFIVSQVFAAVEKDAVSCETSVSVQGGKYRTIRVSFNYPLPSRTKFPGSDWHVWSASSDAPWRLDKTNHLNISYDHIWEHTSIPAVTVYDEKNDIGQTFVKPFDVPAPGLSFRITNVGDFNVEDERSVSIVNDYLGCGNGRDAKISLKMKFHRGDWRDGLGWLCSEYKEYFEPYDESIWEYSGGMICGNITMGEDKIKFLKKAGMTWFEIHEFFPCYGYYMPEEKQWYSLNKTNEMHRKDRPPYLVTHERVEKYIEMLKRNGIASFLYWQTCEIYTELAKKFGDSLLKNRDGSIIKAFPGTYGMNFALETPWGQYVKGQAVKLMERFSEADGIFVDNLCYKWFDFSRDDGISSADNLPCYKTTFGFHKLLGEVAAFLRKRGKFTFANGPINVEVQRHIDGFVAETDPKLLGYLGYMSVFKPLGIIIYSSESLMEALMNCLRYGADIGVFSGMNSEDVKTYKKYLPLLKKFKGRRWCLEPHALKLHGGAEGNIFASEEKGYLVSVVPGCVPIAVKAGVEVCVKDADRIKSVDSCVPGGAPERIKFGRERGKIILDVPAKKVPALLVLK
ncbi:MAG: hypothetical protein JW957_07260 [Candidatus Omnitrophica bacterium]|nr:hypothetical protein [Candidatus Omnitrophota bacterium]